MLGDDFDPKTLPKDADNYFVYCKRCQRTHRYFTFTQEDHARVMKEAVAKLSDAIDASIAKQYLDR